MSYLGFYCCGKHHDQIQLWEEKVYLAYMFQSQSIMKGRKSEQERKEEPRRRPRRDAADWLAPFGLLSLLPYTRQTTCPGVAVPSVRWALPRQSSIKKMNHRLAPRTSGGSIFSTQVLSCQTASSCAKRQKSNYDIVLRGSLSLLTQPAGCFLSVSGRVQGSTGTPRSLFRGCC